MPKKRKEYKIKLEPLGSAQRGVGMNPPRVFWIFILFGAICGGCVDVGSLWEKHPESDYDKFIRESDENWRKMNNQSY